MVRNPQDEKYAIDYITHGLLSASLLGALMDELVAGTEDNITLGEFYRRWSQQHQSERFQPFNEGVALAFMYLGILFARENWPDLVPEDDLSTWNITPLRLVSPKEPQPKLHYFVRRLRNALGHGTPTIHVPAGTTPENVGSSVTIPRCRGRPPARRRSLEDVAVLPAAIR